MSNEQNGPYERLSIEELQEELRRLKENLQDLEETHAFMFGKTTVHIGAEQAQSMQEEYEEEFREYHAQIRKLEGLLREKVR